MKYYRRFTYWSTMKSPIWYQKIMIRLFRKWFTEYMLFYTLQEEITKEIDKQIIAEILGNKND